MRRNAVLLGITTSLFLASTGVSSPALALVLDDFVTAQTVTQSGIGTAGNAATGVAAIFGDRWLQTTITAGTGGQRVTINGPNMGEQAHSQDAGVTGNSLIVWDANSANGTGLDLAPGVDFTDAGISSSLIFGIMSDDWPTNLTFTVYTTLTDFSQVTYATAGLLSNVPVDLAFASFTSFGAGASFDNIRAMTMSIGDTIPHEDLDVRLGFLSTGTPGGFLSTATPVSEPGALAILGGGIVGLGFTRRRRKVAAASAKV